jgi:hypothetical protein
VLFLGGGRTAQRVAAGLVVAAAVILLIGALV